MPINDEDLEIIEETVNDLEYFYEEEETVKRNKRIIYKYRALSVGISVIVLTFLITVLGIARMKQYRTNNILTYDEINYIMTNNECERITKLASDFYLSNSNGEIDVTCKYYEIKNSLYGSEALKLDNESFYSKYLEEWDATLNEAVESLNSLTLPKKKDFTGYKEALITFIEDELYIIKVIYEKYDDITNGNIIIENEENNLTRSLNELSIQKNLLKNV